MAYTACACAATLALGILAPAAAHADLEISPLAGVSRTILQTHLLVGGTPIEAVPAWYPPPGDGSIMAPGAVLRDSPPPPRKAVLLAERNNATSIQDIIRAADRHDAEAIVLYGGVSPWEVPPADIPVVIVSDGDGIGMALVLGGSASTTVTLTYDRNAFEALSSVSDVDTITISGRVFAVATGEDAVQIMDVSDPGFPTYTSAVFADAPGFGAVRGANSVKTVTVDEKPYALIAGENSVLVMDLSDPYGPVPAAVMTDGKGGYTALDGASDIEVIETHDSLFAVVAARNDDGIQVVDISDPHDPRPAAAAFDDRDGFEDLGGARAVAISQIQGRTYAMVAGYDDDAMQVIDMVNPRIPLPLPNTNNFTIPIDGAADVEVVHSGGDAFAIVASHNDNAIHVINMTTPFMPELESAAIDGAGRYNALDRPWDVEVATILGVQQAVVSSFGDDAVQIVDLRNPALPRPVTDTIPEDGDDDGDRIVLGGARGTDIAVISGIPYVLVAGYLDDQMHILDLRQPASPTLAASTLKPEPVDLALDGPDGVSVIDINGRTYGVVANYYQDAVQIFNLTTPGQIRPVSSVFDGEGGFDALDGPVEVETVKIRGKAYFVVTSYNDDAVQIADMTDPANPVPVAEIFDGEGGFEALGGARGLSVATFQGRTVAVVAGYDDDAVQVVDLVSPEFPLPAGAVFDGERYEEDGNTGREDSERVRGLDGPWSVHVLVQYDRVYALVASSTGNSVQILDITNPSKPWPSSYLYDKMPGFGALRGASDIDTAEVAGRTYAVVAGKDGIQVVDATRPAEPRAVSQMRDNRGGAVALGGPNDVEVVQVQGRTYAVVASILDSGMQIVDITEPADPRAVTHAFDGTGGFSYMGGASDLEMFVAQGRLFGVVAGATDDGMHLFEVLPQRDSGG